jgi:preprotein translocase subunit YajC
VRPKWGRRCSTLADARSCATAAVVVVVVVVANSAAQPEHLHSQLGRAPPASHPDVIADILRGNFVNYLPFLIIAVVLVGATVFTRRNRQRALVAQQNRREEIGFGTDVMTTSGLYGTVVGINGDDTVQLSIAPGVEVKWALAALRDVASLPPPAGQQPAGGDDSDDPGGADGPSTT